MTMLFQRVKKVEVLSERTKIPADGRTATQFTLSYPDLAEKQVTLKLHKRGSFAPDSQVREATFDVVNGEVKLTIYAPARPGVALLTGPGLRRRIEFVAASFMQGLLHEWIPTLVYALVFAIVLRSYAVASFYIPSGSMEPTLMVRDLLIADKFSYKVLKQDPQRGDVMIFQYPRDRKTDYIKRVVGLPGETVQVRDGIVYINNQPLSEDYIAEQPLRDFGPETVPPAEYFMMGDNRNHSSDSRVWGFVPRSYFEGRALFVFWPPTRAKIIQHERVPMGAVE
jgi:signal peptidase I